MTGRVRIEGDGHAGMILGALIASFTSRREQRDRQARFARAWMDLALRASRTGYTFADRA
jgi:hypothetical protein